MTSVTLIRAERTRLLPIGSRVRIGGRADRAGQWYVVRVGARQHLSLEDTLEVA
jgi:hypothetical protein